MADTDYDVTELAGLDMDGLWCDGTGAQHTAQEEQHQQAVPLAQWDEAVEEELNSAIAAVERAPVAMVMYIAIKAAAAERRGSGAKAAYAWAVDKLHTHLARKDSTTLAEQCNKRQWSATTNRPYKCVRIIVDYCIDDPANRATVQKMAKEATSLKRMYIDLMRLKAGHVGDETVNTNSDDENRKRKRTRDAPTPPLLWPELEPEAVDWPDTRGKAEWGQRGLDMRSEDFSFGTPRHADYTMLAKDWVILAWAKGLKTQETNNNPFRGVAPEPGKIVQLQRTGATPESHCVQFEVTSTAVSTTRRADMPSNYFDGVPGAQDKANTVAIRPRTLVTSGKLIWAGRVRQSPMHVEITVQKMENIVADERCDNETKAAVERFVKKHRAASPPTAAKNRAHWSALLMGFGYNCDAVSSALSHFSETQMINPADIGPIIMALPTNHQ